MAPTGIARGFVAAVENIAPSPGRLHMTSDEAFLQQLQPHEDRALRKIFGKGYDKVAPQAARDLMRAAASEAIKLLNAKGRMKAALWPSGPAQPPVHDSTPIVGSRSRRKRQRLRSNGSIESDPASQRRRSPRARARPVTPDKVLSFVGRNPATLGADPRTRPAVPSGAPTPIRGLGTSLSVVGAYDARFQAECLRQQSAGYVQDSVRMP